MEKEIILEFVFKKEKKEQGINLQLLIKLFNFSFKTNEHGKKRIIMNIGKNQKFHQKEFLF